MSKKSKWGNKDNNDFYEAVSLNTHKEYAKLGGVANGEDLEVAKNYILKANSILEIGAGYGRVLDYVLKHAIDCNISAIERSQSYYTKLSKKYGNRVRLYNVDLLAFEPNKKYELILWMASSIADFAKHEQLLALEKVASLLGTKGTLVLDTFSIQNDPINVDSFDDQLYTVEMNGQVLHGYIPSQVEISEYAQQSSFNVVKHIPYKTSTNRDRYIHILSR